jgi:hypothetical protein
MDFDFDLEISLAFGACMFGGGRNIMQTSWKNVEKIDDELHSCFFVYNL